MATGEAIVKIAFDQIKSIVNAEDAYVFSNTSLESLWREARKIEDELGARRDLQFMRRLEPFLRSLESYAGVIEVFCQGYAPMAFVWGPIKLMLLLAKNHSTVMEKILQAFNDIANALPRLDKLRATFANDIYFNQVVGHIYSDIMEFHQQVYNFFRRKAWHCWFAFNWGLFEHRFKSILQKLRLHWDLLDKEATAIHFSEMKQFRNKRQFEEDAFEQQRHNQMALNLFSWLSADEDQQENQLHQKSEDRQPETCDWILNDPHIRPWLEDDSGDAILWMTGIPGAGKSVLCSMLVQNSQTRQHLSTLYYFCSHLSSSSNTCAIILRTLAYQLLQQNLDMAPLVHQAYFQKLSNRSAPAMKRLLIEVLGTSKMARVIIDGLDECDHATQREVLKSLVEIQKSVGHCCKLLVSSREEPGIQKSLAARAHLKLGEKTVEGLSLYIRYQIEEIRKEIPEMDSTLVKLAEQRLHDNARGMFLWVRLVTSMLICHTSEVDFRAAIDQLPEGLDAAYGLIKSRINALHPVQLRQRAFSILYWVCLARRPVSLHEVADGVALHPGQKALNKKTRSKNPSRDIVELCAPLLEKSRTGVLELVHFSAKEYFIHEQSGPFIDLAEAHLSIALSCVMNLTSCLDLLQRDIDELSREDLESRVVQGCYGLQPYGQEFWAEHVLAYLETFENPDLVSKEIISALEAFSQLWKHHAHTGTSLPSAPHTAETSLVLNRLCNLPKIQRCVLGWLHFKSEFDRAVPTFNTVEAQKQWRLGKDETFLSLIDSRLCVLTEQILMMQSSHLPSHIDKTDFENFVGRFKFLCGFQGCNYQCDTILERVSHEDSHVMSFPCLQCDFSGRGFRSRKDLEKHTHKYHMSPEDFEIPNDLHAMGGFFEGGPSVMPGALRVSSSRSGRWTERGHKALQQGFNHVLTRLESEIIAAMSDDGEPGPQDVTSAKAAELRKIQHTHEAVVMTSLDSIRHNIQSQKYENLADFKSDLNKLTGGSTTADMMVEDRVIESICDEELEKALSAFPVFANFDHTTSTIMVTLSNNSNEKMQEFAKSLNEQRLDMASTSSMSFGKRVPYWSSPEEKHFPELLQRYGRDFARVADHLKTKTPEDVSQHFMHLLSMGCSDLSDLADVADARLQRESYGNELTMDSGAVELGMQAPDDLDTGNSYHYMQSSQISDAGPYYPPFGNPNPALPSIQGITKRADLGGDSVETMDTPPHKKRRPRPRALCSYCSVHKDGLRDEYALQKHVERFHTATRKVWICEDISIDKRFLTKCKHCLASKRYSSRSNAGKHLRKSHFNTKTSAETLRRWMREIEEPNPNMQTASANSASTTKSATKRPKVEARTVSLPPLKNHLGDSRTLPSMMLETKRWQPSKSISSPRSSSSIDDNMDEDEDTDVRNDSHSSPEPGSFENDVLLEDISFDNFLPGQASAAPLPSNDGPPHRTNRALIRPDQVPRLPNLSSFHKSACSDQVEALYHKLDNAPENGSDYKEALENLTSLSRSLMRNLRDWRQHSTLAPHIPFSI